MTSLAFPILNIPRITLARGIVQVLQDLDELRVSGGFSVNKILFISRDENIVEFLQEYLDQYLY